MNTAILEKCSQQAEWRTRILLAVLNQSFDPETLVAMLDAGWQQAHSEGLGDAAAICQEVADGVENPVKKWTASTLAKACRDLDAENRRCFGHGQR